MDWSCGIHRLPATIEGDPPRAVAAILWLEGALVRSIETVEEPDDPLQHLAGSLDKAMRAPMAGAPGSPRRIRVASEPLARALERLAVPGLRVEVAATPEVDDAVAALTEFTSEPMLSPAEALDEVAEPWRSELERAGAALVATEPWTHLPPEPPLGVRIPGLGLDDGVLAVMGHGGDSYGFMLFQSADDYRIFTALSSLPELDASLLPRCYSLNFEPREPEDIAAIPLVDDPRAIEVLSVPTTFEPGLQRVPSPSELRLVIATTAGLARFLRRRAHDVRLLAAMCGGRPVEGRYRVDVAGERHEVRVRAPSASAV